MSGASEPSKRRLVAEIERMAPLWKDLALQIHAHPEVAFQEVQASAWLSEALAGTGFAVTRGVAELPTSFVAVRNSGPGIPVVAFFAEYDAMPETGHSCGHNLIAGAACLAGQALAAAAPNAVEVRVIGAPAEESGGGKLLMLERGALDGIDFALMAHGGFMSLPNRSQLGNKTIIIDFHGRDTSAGLSPHMGLNALDALILLFNGVALMRQQLRAGAKISGIILHGGKATYRIPDFTQAEFLLRTPEPAYADELEERLLDCARGAAQATGTRMEFRAGKRIYLAMKRNAALEGAYANNLRWIGEPVDNALADIADGSTDFSNVAHAMPGIHAYFRMVPPEVEHHTHAYTEASRSDAGLAGMVAAAKALALTGLDLAEDADLRIRVRRDFEQAMEPLPGTRQSCQPPGE
jgi:amidohydrolase